MIATNFLMLLWSRFGQRFHQFERTHLSSWPRLTRTRALRSTLGVEKSGRMSYLSGQVASFRKLCWRKHCFAQVLKFQFHPYRSGNSLGIGLQLLTLLILCILSRIWRVLWYSSQSGSELHFFGIWLFAPPPFSYFFFRIPLAYRGLFCIWIWKPFSQQRKFGHPQGQLYSPLGSRSVLSCISHRSTFLAYPSTLLIFHLRCSSPSQSRNSLYIFVALQSSCRWRWYSFHPICCGISRAFSPLFWGGWQGRHTFEIRIWEPDGSSYPIF